MTVEELIEVLKREPSGALVGIWRGHSSKLVFYTIDDINTEVIDLKVTVGLNVRPTGIEIPLKDLSKHFKFPEEKRG